MWVKVAGWVLVVSAGLAWYVAAAMLLAASFGRTVLPLLKYGGVRTCPAGGRDGRSSWSGPSRASGRASSGSPQAAAAGIASPSAPSSEVAAS